MDKLTKDILPDNCDFFIEKFTYPPYVTMNNSHYHRHYEILYMLRGERKLIINNISTYILNEGTIAIIPPNCIHKTKSHSNDEQTRICIAVSENLVKQITQFTTDSLLHCASFYNIELNTEMKRNVRNILSKLILSNNGMFYESNYKVAIAQLLLDLSEYTYNNEKYNSIPILYNNSSKKRMDEIIKYIQEHAFEDISLVSIADTFHIPKTYLSRCFKKHTGSTVVTYINNIRIIKAQQIICEKNISIESAAHIVGYNNRGYFNKVFKKLTGTTPKEYQQLMQNFQNNE